MEGQGWNSVEGHLRPWVWSLRSWVESKPKKRNHRTWHIIVIQ